MNSSSALTKAAMLEAWEGVGLASKYQMVIEAKNLEILQEITHFHQ